MNGSLIKRITVVTLSVLVSLYARNNTLYAAEDPYAVIIKKNLFNPERKEWIMESKKTEETKKVLPKIDTKQIQLMGTVISGSSRKAVIKNAMRAGSKDNTEIYMEGDYIEGYLLKEISARKVVLNNSAANEDVILFLHEGKTQRSAQKTEIPAAPELKQEKPRYAPKKAETGKDLMERVKKTMGIFKRSQNEMVKKQAERDMEKLDRLIGTMSDEERGQLVQLKKELNEVAKKR